MKYANDNSPLMAPKEASSLTTLSRVLLTNMAREGVFPKPVKLGAKRIAYVRSEVLEWIAERTKARHAA